MVVFQFKVEGNGNLKYSNIYWHFLQLNQINVLKIASPFLRINEFLKIMKQNLKCNQILMLKITFLFKGSDNRKYSHIYWHFLQLTYFFLDLFLYIAIDIVFHSSGIIENGRRNSFQNFLKKLYHLVQVSVT